MEKTKKKSTGKNRHLAFIWSGIIVSLNFTLRKIYDILYVNKKWLFLFILIF